MERVTRWEWRWTLAVALLTVMLSSVPYVVGYLSQSPERVFAGAVYDWEDYYSHLAKMQQGVRGQWLYYDLFTPEDHPGAYINTFYIALGHLSAALGLSPVSVYHLARPVCALTLLLAAYRFVACFVFGLSVRRTAFVLICFSSGLGWLVLLVTGSFTLMGITPVDFWFIEMYTFFSVLTFPHTCLAMALHLIAFAWMVQVLWGEGNWRDWLIATGAAMVLTVIHPYSVLPLDAALFLWWLYSLFCQRGNAFRRLPRLIGFCALPLPLVLYGYRAISSNPVLSAWQAQSYTLSPPPVHYVLGYGLVLVLAVWGGVRVMKRDHDAGDRNDHPYGVALVLWVLAVCPLLYAPVVFHLQRRMVEGMHAPLCVLAAVGLNEGLLPLAVRSRLAGWLAGLGYPRSRLRRLVQTLVIALTVPSTVYLLVSLSLGAASGYAPLYYSRNEIDAVRWLGEHSTPWDTVLASYEVSGYIPAHIGRRVFWGHWAESIDLPQKRAEVEAFYSSAPFDRLGFLARYRIIYVFYGPRERRMGDWNPATASWLEPVFQQGDVTVYRVTR